MFADDEIPECRHGKAPVKLMNADPSVPYLKGAAFDLGRKDRFQDPRYGWGMQIKEKIGMSYRILILPSKSDPESNHIASGPRIA
jgi:hypothetical protein